MTCEVWARTERLESGCGLGIDDVGGRWIRA
ncbi:hypothetical protein SCE1572_26780 [Sorangium cellulosum So0157-2]|uniref:Uncharacterized protein n=1 Tax=Sorangium cellulosum So0157-2 TaxID=1254432 RepID=S4XX21_SORCE|nr:hypothetical protein SCE1572_26780 [Sorangium cellulosum So0157-2]